MNKFGFILLFSICLGANANNIVIERNDNKIVLEKENVEKEVMSKINDYIKDNIKDCPQLKKGIENMGSGTGRGFSKKWFKQEQEFSAYDYFGWSFDKYGTIKFVSIDTNSCEVKSLILYFGDAEFSKENEEYNLNIEKNSLKKLKYLLDNIYSLGKISKKGDVENLVTDFYWGTPVTELIHKYL